jgi:hypothetical protein
MALHCCILIIIKIHTKCAFIHTKIQALARNPLDTIPIAGHKDSAVKLKATARKVTWLVDPISLRA